MRNKRIFVSGGSGVIGTALVNQLLAQEADVFVGDLKPCPKEWLGKVKYWQGDLNYITCEELLDFDPEIFFHLAATFERSEETFPFFEENFHHNIKLSHHLTTCFKESSNLKHIVFASSYLIYDPHLYQFKHLQPVVSLKEDSSIYPRNICGAAKLLHELELRFLDHFLQKRTHIACARIFRVYGRSSRDIISRWIRAALREETLTVYRPEGQFDYVFADDVAEGLIKLSQSNFNGIINLGSGNSRSVKDILAILKSHFPDLEWKEEPSDVLFEASQADMSHFQQVTGWMPTHTLETAIPKIIQYEQERLYQQFKPDQHITLLVTSISKKIPLLQALRQATDQLGQFKKICGCDIDLNCIGQYGVDTFWHCPPLSHLKIEDILSYCQEQRISVIIPTRDADLEFYSKNLALLNQNDIHVMVSSAETVTNCYDKLLFAKILSDSKFPAIPTSLTIDEIASQSYVVKERYGSGASKIGINLSKEEAIEDAKKIEHPIFQPYVKGSEWSIDLYRSRHGKVMGCVARQRDVVVRGESQVTTTASYPSLEKLCHDLAIHLNIYGHAVFQVIEDEEGNFHIIECNPRFGGASTASLAVGLDSFYWFLLECLDQNIEEYPFLRSKKEVRQVRYPADWILPWL